MHTVEYQQQTFTFPKPLNQSKYVGTTADVDAAWKDLAEGKLTVHCNTCIYSPQKTNVLHNSAPTDGLLVRLPCTPEAGRLTQGHQPQDWRDWLPCWP